MKVMRAASTQQLADAHSQGMGMASPACGIRVASCWLASQAMSPSSAVTRFTNCCLGSSGDLHAIGGQQQACLVGQSSLAESLTTKHELRLHAPKDCNIASLVSVKPFVVYLLHQDPLRTTLHGHSKYTDSAKAQVLGQSTAAKSGGSHLWVESGAHRGAIHPDHRGHAICDSNGHGHAPCGTLQERPHQGASCLLWDQVCMLQRL